MAKKSASVRFERPVFILGAGATKACGGPLTGEILPWACRRDVDSPMNHDNRQDMLRLLEEFLDATFNLPAPQARAETDFPDLPLLMSLIDDAIDRGLQFGQYDADRLRKVRTWLNFAIAEVIKWSLEERKDPRALDLEDNPHMALLRPFYQRPNGGPPIVEPTVISFNYDVIVDNSMLMLGATTNSYPDYRCDIGGAYANTKRFGRLLKPHGSLNWTFCPACQGLDLFYDDESKDAPRSPTQNGLFAKAIDQFFVRRDDDPFRGTSAKCNRQGCLGRVRPVLITPTNAKDYRNPHLAQTWYEAERALSAADRVVIIGYSLPSDDVAIVSMLKRALLKLDPTRITVIEDAGKNVALSDHPIGRRYRWLFGPTIEWFSEGFERWVQDVWPTQTLFLGRDHHAQGVHVKRRAPPADAGRR